MPYALTEDRRALVQANAVALLRYGEEKIARLKREIAMLQRSREGMRAEIRRLREIVEFLTTAQEE